MIDAPKLQCSRPLFDFLFFLNDNKFKPLRLNCKQNLNAIARADILLIMTSNGTCNGTVSSMFI